MRPFVPRFAVACLLGGAGAWLWPRATPALPAPGAHTAPSPTIRLPGWDWRSSLTPEPLPPETLPGAIAAWLALRAPDGGPADFATRAEALHALLARLRNEDFPRLLTPLFADTTPAGRRLLGIAFNLYVDLDPASAARWAAAAAPKDDGHAHYLARLATEAWMKKDPAAALAWARTLPDQSLVQNLARPLLLQLAKVDPAAAVREFGDLFWDGGRQAWHLNDALSAWAERNPAAALAWIIAQPRAPNGTTLAWLIGQLKPGADPRTLLEAIATVPDLPDREQALWSLTQKWSGQQPEAALAWIQALPDAHRRQDLLERLSMMWPKERPDQALPYALALPKGANRTFRLAHLLAEWAQKDPSAALSWLTAQDDPAVRAAAPKAQAAILGAIARDEPATAIAEWQALTDPKTKTAAIGPIVEAWSQKDPGAALRWLQTQPPEFADSGFTFHYAHQALYPWSLKEPEAALRWAEAQPSQKAYYLKALAGDGRNKADRAAVSALYAKIADPALRAEVLTAHVREWLAKDRPAAQAWLEANSALTPEQAAALLAPAPQP